MTTPHPTEIGTCGSGDPVVKDCNHVDYGFCGNACCKVTANIPHPPGTIAQLLNASLASGGPDLGYSLQELAENGEKSFFPLSSEWYIGQAHHTTSGPAHYVDVVNFLIQQDTSNKHQSFVTIFSTSLIAGALGDGGQNYKNIIMAMQGASIPNWDGPLAISGGCGQGDSEIAFDMVDISKSQSLTSPKEKGTCGLGDVHPPDCTNIDSGSCGNACCGLVVSVAHTAADTVKLLNNSLDNGGPDGFYTKSMTAEGPLGFASLTGMAPPSFCTGGTYIGQAHHDTNGGKNVYTDTVNFNICDSNGGSIIRVFSLSLIAGAYADSGQGYKNIKMVMDKAFGDENWTTNNHMLDSCPPSQEMYQI